MVQVCALWKVLHDRGYQYSNATSGTQNSNQNISSQPIRTFDHALNNNQADSMDGTVVFASLLRAMNIPAVMVFTSKYGLVGFYTSTKKDRKLVYLETTMLSDSEFIDVAKTKKQKDEAYIKQFLAAVKTGNETYQEYKVNNYMHEIDVDYYRKYVSPLPFK